MSAADTANVVEHRQQELYWKQLVEVKVVSSYIRLYRDEQSVWINRLGMFRAVATSSTIAGWAIWKDYAFVWGIILAASQVADALKAYLPNAKRQRSASELVNVLESLLIDAKFEWESVFAGTFSAEDILSRYRKLARLQLEAEKKFFPDGLPPDPRLRALAERDASAYFKATYGVEAQSV